MDQMAEEELLAFLLREMSAAVAAAAEGFVVEAPAGGADQRRRFQSLWSSAGQKPTWQTTFLRITRDFLAACKNGLSPFSFSFVYN